MVQEYIGARYVPKFMGTYDATQIYEALSVVDNGLGTSYISKIPTPAGTPLTDTDHWAIYGASSGAIIDLQDQIDNINNTELPAIQADVDDLSDKLDLINNRRFVFIGDSYNEGTVNNVVGATDPWGVRVANLLGIASADYVSAGTGGADFASGDFLSLLNNNLLSDPDTVTDVLCMGGINDGLLADTSGELSAITAFYTRAKELYPNAKLYIGYLGNTDGTDRNSIFYKANYFFKQANALGVIVMPTWINNPLHDYDNISADNIHPTVTGYDFISKEIASYLRGGYDIFSPAISTATLDVTNADVDTGANAVYYYGTEVKTIEIQYTGNIPIADTITLSGQFPKIKLGAVPASWGKFSAAHTKRFACLQCRFSDSTWGNLFGDITIENNMVIFTVNNIESTGYGTYVINRLQTDGLSIITPTITS